MKHQPKKLALLISLIGAGVSPYACARSDARVMGLAQATLNTALEEPVATALDRTRWSPGLVWRTEEAEVDLAEPLDALRAAGPIREEGAPDEVPEGSRGWGQPAAADAPSANAEASLQRVATVRFSAAPSVPPDAQPSSAHADRLMEILAAVVLEDMTTSSGDPVLSTVPQRLPAPVVAPPASEPPAAAVTQGSEAAAQRIERSEIVVATQSGKVLRSLEAILSNGRDEVGAIRAEPSETIVATQAEKVLATLAEISSARNAPEDGAAKRARKLAAAKLRVEAAEAAAAVVAAPDPEPKVRPSPFGGERVAVSEKSLDGVRGGFVTDGLNISFGIERAVYVNGTLVTTTSLNLSDLGRITAGRGTTAFDSGTLALIQSGAGNTVSPGAISAASVGTVVQNTLDGQKIQNLTVVNATVNSLGVLRGLNLQSSLRSAVIDSLRR